jgi:hypothetical protein
MDVEDDNGFRALPVAGGLVVGFVATWVLFVVTLLVVYANYGESTGTIQDVIAFSGLLAPPILFGLLLIPRRTRHFGAGLLMGLAIGSITAAGICGGFFGLNAM